VESFQSNAARRLGAIENFAVTISSNAQSQGQKWPFVTIDDYELRANYTLDLAEVISIIFLPFVGIQDREQWETYSVQHQAWFNQGLALQGDVAKDQPDEQVSIDILQNTWPSPGPGNAIPEQIIRVNGTGVEVEKGKSCLAWS
jgi:hypothetical protein